MKLLRKRLTYANVMSSIAVFLVLGGATAFAASKIGSNEIKGNAITTGKIKKEAVTKAKLKNGSVTTEKLANDAVTGDKAKESSFSEVPSAANAASLGGKSASEYSVRYFARVTATAAVPTLAAGSPGVTVKETRPFTGGVYVVFPVDMTNCAIVATAFTGGATIIARQSNISEGKEVAIITETDAGALSNQSFNVIGVC